ncbi:MAG: DUF134 domain-containing protein [Clostridia bacterium]|nr:DUF134 domain-containing protein [Clostridia bacterium]
MPRPQRFRRVCAEPVCLSFSPDKPGALEDILLSVDEFEVIRLVDHEKMTHEQCARQMDISRTTVTEVYESARFKLSKALVEGRRLLISGGNYKLCDGSFTGCKFGRCIDSLTNIDIEKGEHTMRIAVTFENGQIFQHFGHTEQFKVYDIENGQIVSAVVADTNGSGHGALAGFLKLNKVDALICGGIGMGAQMALAQAGIALYAGVKGDADEAVKALAKGELSYDPNANCDHHGHSHGDHDCADHNCSDHGCEGHDHNCGDNCHK